MKFALLFASYLLVAFGQPAWIPFFAPLAAAFGFALFWRAQSEWKSPVQRFWLAALWFGLVQSIQLSWMTTTDYMGPLILLVYAGLLFCLGLQFALLSHLVQRNAPPAAIAGAWVLFEWVRLYACTGFTWNPVGLSLAATPFSLQAASLFGIYGLSFWVIFTNLAALRALTQKTRSACLAWAAFALLPFGFGAVQHLIHAQSSPTLSVLLEQPGLLPHEKDYDPQRPEGFVAPWRQWKAALAHLEAAQSGPVDLIVFPEGAFPYSAYRPLFAYSTFQSVWTERFGAASTADFPPLGGKGTRQIKGEWFVSNAYWTQAIANHYQSEVVIGLDDQNLENGQKCNAAFHFLPGQTSAARYEKRILVPIAEYIPLRHFKPLSQFILNQFGIGDSFVPGVEAKIFFGKIPLGVSICYEETFSDLIQQNKTKGAKLLVNLSNDGWFPRSRLAVQHYNHGLIRAVENGLPSVRACNTGITTGLDCFGKPLAALAEMEPGALHLHIPLQTIPTLYSFWGDAAILILSALFPLLSILSRRFLPEIKTVD